MSKNRIIIVLGALVALVHLLDGLPQAWESFFGILLGFSIVLISIWANVDKRLTLRAKAQKRQIHKMRMKEIGAESQIVSDSSQGVLQEESI